MSQSVQTELTVAETQASAKRAQQEKAASDKTVEELKALIAKHEKGEADENTH